MIVLSAPVIKPINWDLLKDQAKQAFPKSFIDCNETDNGSTATVYLEDGSAQVQTLSINNQDTWITLVANHDASALSVDQQKVNAKDAAYQFLVSLDKNKLDPVIANTLTFLGF